MLHQSGLYCNQPYIPPPRLRRPEAKNEFANSLSPPGQPINPPQMRAVRPACHTCAQKLEPLTVFNPKNSPSQTAQPTTGFLNQGLEFGSANSNP
jgi:hypothetical protein